MRRVGCVLHISSNGNIILKGESLPRIGDKVVDTHLKLVGRVFDIFGPTRSPYVAVKPDVKDARHLVNHILYSFPSHESRKSRK